eukprot:NODE_52_length_30984_cov_1.383358.p9 type:complete len:409 gc:universal NODE_52_length_30984_cov_1.383358:6587-7813(+)
MNDQIYLRSLGINKIHDVVDHLIPNYNVSKELRQHTGCVNTVQFNKSGDLMVSGSDDKYICLWDGFSFELKEKIFTNHGHNIFSAVLLENGEGVLSCCAKGDVKLSNFSGDSTQIYNHQNDMAYQIELVDRNTFMSCGENGIIMTYDLREAHYGASVLVDSHKVYNFEKTVHQASHKNTMTGIPSMSMKNDIYFAAAFNDDFVRTFDRRWAEISINAYCPDKFNPYSATKDSTIIKSRLHMTSKITSCQYDPHGNGSLVISYGGNCVYVIDPDQDFTGDNYFKTNISAKCLSGHLNRRTMIKETSFLGNSSRYVMSGSDDGRLYIWDLDTEKIVNCFEADDDVVNCTVSHPFIPCIVLSGIDNSIKVCFPEHESFDEAQFEEYLGNREISETMALRLPLDRLMMSTSF